MKNRIIYITKAESTKLKEMISNNNDIFLVEADGTYIQSEEEFVKEMEIGFKVPYGLPPVLNLGWYFDDITRLTWIKESKIIILIHNFNLMLSNYQIIKQRIIDNFNEITLPWWEKDVVGHMVGGTVKEFLVYLVV